MASRKIGLTLATVIFIAIGGFLSWKIYTNGQEFKEYRVANSKILDGEQRLTDWKEWLNLSDLFGDRKEKSETAESNAMYYYNEAIYWSMWICGAALIYFLSVLFIFRRATCCYRYLSFSLVMIAFIFLAIGISVPMLEIGAFKDMLNFPIKGSLPIIGDYDISKQFDGRMYFFYQNKSILDVIALLFTHGNILVGTFILLFSIISPVLKLSFSLYLVFNPNNKNKLISFFVTHLGKWSMADVFVVSIFLGYLSFQNMSTGVDMEANTLLGLYFFMTFVILSLISSLFLKLAEKKQKETIIIN